MTLCLSTLAVDSYECHRGKIMPKPTLIQVSAAQRNWFTDGNKRFFGDVSYEVAVSASGKPYLLRSTYGWTDMFGRPRRLHWRINPLDAKTLKILPLVEDVFDTKNKALKWLRSQ